MVGLYVIHFSFYNTLAVLFVRRNRYSMSKETKFLSIAIGLLQGKLAEGGVDDPVVKEMNADRLYDFTRFAVTNFGGKISKRTNNVDYDAKNDRNRFHRNGILEGATDLGSLIVETRCDGVGTPAQVKLFKLLEGETPETFNRVNGKITMIRDMTGFDGVLSRKLSEGTYVVEISKGSEYEIITDSLEIKTGEYTKKLYDLNRFYNLSKAGWIAGDLHHHSVYSSPVYAGDDDVVETPQEIANSMMAMGLEYGALSDHHNVLNHEAWKAGKRDNFTPIVSKEISTSNGHVMAMGVDEDVIYDIPQGDRRTDEFLRNEFRRVTTQIKELGGLPQINHPRDLSVSISWNPNFYDMIDIFETMEIWNGSNPMMAGSTNDLAYKLWLTLMQRGLLLPATTGSDTHNIAADDYHILFDQIMDTVDIIKASEKELEEKYKDELHVFKLITESLLPILEKWAETNLTSGGVRTYINIEGERNQENVLKTLKSGHSFLTNGPILIPTVNGKKPGEKLEKSGKLDIDIKLLANTELKKLLICTENGTFKEIDLKANKEKGFYDYSMHISEDVEEAKYVFFIAKSDCTNLAISNPVICC